METDDATPDLHTCNGEHNLAPYVYEIPAKLKLAWKRISFDVTFRNFLRGFFLKEEEHMGQVAESGALDSRLNVCYSQIQLSILIHFYLWRLSSLISNKKLLYVKEMQDFLQPAFRGWTSVQTSQKAIKCLCNQRGKV